MNGAIHVLLEPFDRRNLTAYASVFLGYFLIAIVSLYIYYEFSTSPALVWPPVGIALAAVILGGYRMCAPIFLAHLISTNLYIPGEFLQLTIISAAFALQAAVALYLLRQFGFMPDLSKLRNVLVYTGVAFFATSIEPILVTAIQVAFGFATIDPVVSLARSWGAGIFSALVFTPFIVMWYLQPRVHYARNTWLEVIGAFAALSINNVFLFWTELPQYTGIAAIFFLPAALIWFALRLEMRVLTLAVFWTALMGIAGTLLINPSGVPINEQLLSVVIYIGLISAIFFVFTVVAEERRAIFKTLQSAYASTSSADKAKNEFIAILAHELRNPLSPIVSSLELLKLEPQTPEALKTIANAEDHTTMIRRLLDDLLDTARLSQKKFKLQVQHTQLRELVDQSVASVQDLMHKKNHTLATSHPESDIQLHVDPVRIKQVIINLLDNAAKYTKPGGRIELSCVREDHEVAIRIRDNGIGIEEGKLHQIFEPFKQLESGERVTTGLGIGLFLTKRLTEMHAGHIEAQSGGLGNGSTFTVYLPLPQQLHIPAFEEAARTTRHTKSTRILVVDDNEVAASSLQKLLRHHGHHAHVAFSGAAALQQIGLFSPEIVLLDIGMPDMDGYGVAKRLRDMRWNGLIVALTGFGQETDLLKTRSVGFDHHLIKPVAIADVLDIVWSHKPTEA